ncbi:collagen alpha-3(VI) chain-like [Haliotis asinina]|uniref:collagen alpha-3(VI) chain-like n=1 Tax=Haliotis asinina TaxID=109174 RepID=UPI003531CC6D
MRIWQLLIVLGLLHLGRAVKKPSCSRNKLDLVFLLDSSGSVKTHNFKRMLSFMKNFLSTASIDDGKVRVGVAIFNSRATIKFHLNKYKTKKALFRAIDKIKYRGGRTNTFAGLRLLRSQMFKRRRGDRRGAKNVALVVTDGLSNVKSKRTIPEAKAVRRAGIHIFAIGIGLTKTAELDGIASRPAAENRFTVRNFKKLKGLKDRVFTSVCQFVTAPGPAPLPPKGCSRNKLDLVFLLDSSGSVKTHNFKRMLSFMKNFLSTASIDDGKVRVGVAIFNSRATIKFHLNKYKTKKALFRAIDKIKYRGGRTNTFAGLRLLRSQMFKRRRGDRRGAKNVALVVTDGLSNVKSKRTIPEAKAVRRAGIHIFAIGIGLKKTAELDGIASRPAAENRFTVRNFKKLKGLKDRVFTSVCQFVTAPGPAPLPPKGCSRNKLDLVFLLDSSGSVKTHNFKRMLSFMKNFLSTASIDDGKVRVGVAIFNSRATIKFHLNKYKTKKALFRAIDKIKYRGGRTNTFAGLRLLRSQMFKRRRGDRRGAKNVALVVTDGLSNVKSKRTIPEAKAVRRAGIHIFAIGIGLTKTAELDGIASRPAAENRFTVRNFKKLKGLRDRVFTSVCQFVTAPGPAPLPPKGCSRNKLDLVFLLDSSGSVKTHNFKRMLSFMKNFLSTASIDDGKVRVGVAIFNSRATIKFHLNKYKTKKALFRAIDKVKYRGGRTNTFAGLRLLRSQMFKRRRGDRRGAKNVALVVTDGLSNVKSKRTIPEAKAVRRAGIHIFAIGIGLTKTAELDGIASRPAAENRFTVRNFKKLKGLKDRVFTSVCQFVTAPGPAPLPPKGCSRNKLDLVFLLDSSGSVKTHNFKRMLSFMKNFLSTASIDDGKVRVGVAIFNSRATIKFHLNKYKTKKALFRAIDKIKYRGGRTNTFAGLRLLRSQMFKRRRGDRRGAKNVALVVTDGLSNVKSKRTIPEAKAVRRAGIHIFAIGIGLTKTAELDGIASRPAAENRFTVRNFKKLKGLKDRVFTSVCQFVTAPGPAPLPPKGCSRNKLDLVFLLDSSGSVKTHNFKRMLSFMKNFLSTASIDDGKVRVGVAIFNSRATIKFHLNKYKTKKALFRAIDKIKYRGGRTNTFAGLRLLRSQMFKRRRGDRRGAKNVALVVTDGLSNVKSKRTIPEAKAVRRAGIHIFAIGIGLTKTTELDGIASRPAAENRFTVRNFKKLKGLKDRVFTSVCQFVTAPGPAPLPPKGCSRNKLDLVFLLDSSGSVKTHNFKRMLSFMKNFLSTASIDDGKVRVGVAIFNSRATIKFHLNKYKTKKALFRAIDKIKYRGGRTNTFAGLRLLRSQMFKRRRGDRRGAKNVALVVTDGLSNVKSKRTIPEAKAVRRAGIHIFAIGIGLTKTAELDGIASRPAAENRFTVRNFKKLKGLKDRVFTSVCQFVTAPGPAPLPPKGCSRNKLDLVFLLDSSGSVKTHNFKRMLSFMKNFLSTASIDDGKVRVGVAIFNSRATIKFHLNKYKTKKALFRAIDKIKYRGGRTNTFAGLRLLRSQMFKRRRGDRRGAKNVALVVTDGLSNVKSKRTIPEAKAVRRAGIHIFAIGIGLTKTTELDGIASRPAAENRFTVRNFKKLKGLKDRVFTSVCQFVTAPGPAPLPPKGCSRNKLDLVFLLDSSGSVKTHNFKRMLSFMKNFLSTASIDDGKVRVGVAIFNSRATIKFHLNKYKTKKALFRAIDKIKYRGGRTNTFAGLRLLRSQMFKRRRGDRRGAKNVALVVTDGLSNVKSKRTIPEAKAVRRAGIHIFAIGIGLTKTTELDGIASRPAAENRFTVRNFKKLKGLKDRVFTSVCQFVTAPGPAPLPPKGCSRNKLDLVFLLDSSGSVKTHNFKRMLSFMKNFLSTASIDDGKVRVGVAIFNSRATIKFHLNKYKTKKALFRAIDKIKYRGGRTNTFAGLRLLRSQMFKRRRGDRRGAKNVALVVTDGLSNVKSKRTIPEAKAVRRAGIHIFAIGIGLTKTAELDGIASRPAAENRFTVRNFKKLKGLKDRVFTSVCQFVTAPGPAPLPPKGCSRNKLDLVFLLDSSGSVKTHNFKRMLSFMKNFLSTASIDDGKVRVGVAIFNSRATIKFHLNKYKTKKALFRAIDKVKYRGGRTNTFAGLRLLRSQMFKRRRGDRRGAKNVALVVTDGLSNVKSKRTIPEAKAVRRAGIHIFAIGIGLTKTAELDGIASRPAAENRFTVRNFKKLKGLKDRVFTSVCQFVTAPGPAPLPPKGCSRNKLDLVFLLDSSGSVKTHNFKRMLSFMKNFLSTASIDDGKVRVGVAIFNSRATIKFHLNKYKTKKALFRAIDKIKYRGGRTNTFAGLRLLRSQMFKRRRGDRRGAKNVALVVTDGLSNVKSKRTIPEAKAVRRAGIHIFAIGIGLTKTAELDGIASRPAAENRFTVRNFKKLKGLRDRVFTSVCQFVTAPGPAPLPPKGCSRNKLDLVFLLDSSGSVKTHNFKRMLSFMKNFLSTASIDDGKVRVGVAIFNSRATIKFHLNKYKTKKALFRAIDKIKYRGGRTNTFAGLRLLRSQMFKRRRGDRRGAKNVALVVTDGLSNVKSKRTIPEAKAVRRAGIHIFAIGIGLTKTAELDGIASRPAAENRFTVRNFKKLKGLKDRVFTSVCQFVTAPGPAPLPPKGCSRNKLDLVFLLDSSGSVKTHNFKRMLSFMKNFLSTASIDDGKVRVGVAIFNSRATIKFHLNKYKTKKALFRAIDKIKYRGGRTNTFAGLRLLRSQMFKRRRGDRRGAKNVALVVTDGLSNVKSKRTIPEAKAVRRAGIHIFAIGIGLTKTAELDGIASRPAAENRFTVRNFKKLKGLKDRVFTSVCQFVTAPGPAPLPPKGCSRNKLDLVFLLDSSGSVKTHNFKRMLSFMKNFLSTASIDDGKVRVGVAIFNSRATIKFHLNKYKTKKALFRAIDKIKYRGGRTNTFAGLRLLRSQMFKRRRGDRRGAKNVALVVTDGLSNVKSKRTIPEAKAVRRAGIHIFAIGIGLTKTAELDGIASRPAAENRFTVRNFKKLKGLKDRVFTSVCQFVTAPGPAPLPPKGCSRNKLDLVFLLDSSGSVKTHNFKRMLSFMKNFLSTASIDDGKVRVGVAIFNSRATIKFHLKKYKTKKALFRAIDKIKYRGGRTNTFAGLRLLRSQMFKRRRGDRRGAKNVALVVTDGLSNVKSKRTIPEAKAVRRAGIHIFAIGIGLTKTAELDGIASRPAAENRFTVRNFKKLKGLKDRVFTSVCQFVTAPGPAPLPPKGCSRNKLDLVFLLDSSGSVKTHNFKRMLSFMKNFLSTASIDDGKVRVGVAIFNSRATIKFHLNKYKTKKALFRAIDKIKYRGGRTNTFAGLRLLRSQMFKRRRGDRRGAKNVALVVTDGLSNVKSKRTIPEAKAVRRAGIHIFAIGIGLTKTAELDGIASRPAAENRFTIRNFKKLKGLKDRVFTSVCQFVTAPGPAPLPPQGVYVCQKVFYLVVTE